MIHGILINPTNFVLTCISIWERADLAQGDPVEDMEPQEVGQSVLFFGNRNAHADYFFRDEWQQLGLDVYTAFSRDQPQKHYVHHELIRQKDLILDLMVKDCFFYICGSSGSMPQTVLQTLKNIYKEWLCSDEQKREKAEELTETKFSMMIRRGRYLQETW
jgi:sulfite reductase alpha subunit-like flavoprotein